MTIKVYDWQGNERDMAYLKGKYGNFVFQSAASGSGPVFKVTTLREKVNTAATLVVRVIEENGTPIDGLRVAWYWPDAPTDPNAGPKGGVPTGINANRCVTGTTNAAGDVGFGMGHGAYYWPNQGQIGPHATWIHGANTRSDLINGLGMVAATNHDHFDVEFTRIEDGVEPPEPPEPPEPGECPKQEILAELAKISAATSSVRTQMDRIDSAARAIRKLLE